MVKAIPKAALRLPTPESSSSCMKEEGREFGEGAWGPQKSRKTRDSGGWKGRREQAPEREKGKNMEEGKRQTC